MTTISRRHGRRRIAAGMLLPLLLILCAAPPARAEALSRTQIQGFADYARATWARSGVPGMALAVVQDDRVVLELVLGTREAGRELPVTRDTVFQLASVSKGFAAALVAALVGDGTVGWDDAIIEHYPGFRLMDGAATLALSLRDGLAQRAGLYHHAGDELEAFGYGRAEIVRRLRFLPPEAPFRTTFAYQNYVLTAAADAAARAAGMPFEELIEARLFRPLGMATASARHADFAARLDRAVPHRRAAPGAALQPGPALDADQSAPAAGLSASLADIEAWLRFQLAQGRFGGRTVVDPEALAETQRPQTLIGLQPPPGPAVFYGLGWFVLRYPELTALFHDGAFEEGANTIVTLIPERGIGMAVLTNALPVGLATVLSDRLIDTVRGSGDGGDGFDAVHAAVEAAIAEAFTPAAPPAPAGAGPMGPLDRYAGSYENPYYGRIAVAASEGGLAMRLGRAASLRRLRPHDGDVLVDTVSDRFATFAAGPDGRAAALILQPRFAQQPDAIFTRVP